jgi:hypothetical protein
MRFVEGQQFHSSTVDQLDFREIDGDDTAVLERDAKDFHVFPCNPPTDAENNTLLNRKSVDSGRHRGPSPEPTGKPDATRSSLKMQQKLGSSRLRTGECGESGEVGESGESGESGGFSET